MNIAVIPARGGSKRIPRKNVKPFCGKPMIAWSIEAAQKSGCFDRIIVSTDDDEIAAVARAYGAEVPFRRPTELSDDHTPTGPVIAHAIRWQQEQLKTPVAYACCIYATAPMLLGTDLRDGFAALKRSKCAYAFSVASFSYPIQRALELDANGRASMVHPEYAETRSQDLVESFHDAGQFYWGQADAWLNSLPIFGSDSVAVPLPRKRVQDIDTAEDWELAELLFRAMWETMAPTRTGC